MSHSELLFRDEARLKLLAGTTLLADALRATLGPESRSVLLERKWGTPEVCDDGVTIAKRITLKDPVENLGAQLLRDAAVQTGQAVGDGTTTSTLLAHAMFSEGVRNLVVGTSAIGMKRGLRRGLAAAVRELQAISRPITGKIDTAHVATVSAHNDPVIGDLVAEAIEKVGSDGVVEVEEARGTETALELVEGMQLDKGFQSPYFVTDPDAMECVLDHPVILLIDRKLTAMNELLPLLEEVVKSGRSLLVVAESVEAEALATLVVNKVRGALAACAVKAPGFGDRRKALLEDIASLTGGRVISTELGLKLESVTIADLGQAGRVVIDKDTTTIIEGAGSPIAVKDRCNELRKQVADTTPDYDREKLEERLAKLSGGVAVIRVGRCDGAERVGVQILARALEQPARQIAINAGVDPGPVVERCRNGTGFFGFDARDRTFADLDDLGVVDPTKVVRAALENAVEIEDRPSTPLPPDLE